jgi:hypothetical protein
MQLYRWGIPLAEAHPALLASAGPLYRRVSAVC